MKYYFSTEYVNMAISTNGSMYVVFKKNCEGYYKELANKEFSFGQCDCFDLMHFSVDYWKEYKTSLVIPMECYKVRGLIKKIGENDIVLTGAGLSRSAGIPTQTELENQLYLNNPRKLYESCMINPNDIIKRLRFFYCRLSVAKPTAAHYKIKSLYERVKFTVATENLDLLHEKTGVNAVHIPKYADEIKDCVYKHAFLIGVGNPCCQSILKQWEQSGTKIYAISLTKPNLDVSNFGWYSGSIDSVLF